MVIQAITLLKNYSKIIGSVAIVILTLSLSSLYYNYKIDNLNEGFNKYKIETSQEYLNQKLSILEQNSKIKDENEKLSLKLKGIEDEKYKIYNELQESNTRLKSAIADGSSRLYVNASCPTSTSNSSSKATNSKASSLANGTSTKAVIDRRDGEAIIRITEKADKYKSQLEALQEWVNNLE